MKKATTPKKKMAMGGTASNALKTFNDNKAMAYKKAGGSMDTFKKSLPKHQLGVEWVNKGVANNIKKDNAGILTEADLAALAHQSRGMGPMYGTYIKKYNPYLNDLGSLTPAQQKQLATYMNNASLPQKVYEALPNVGAFFNSGASVIPQNSILNKQKKGGPVMAKGGVAKAKKFAALAPPYNKATAADRIVGAKKKKK